MNSAVGSRHECQFVTLRQNLGEQVKGEIEGGYKHGELMGPIIFTENDKARLMHLVELKKFREVFFGKNNNVAPAQGGRQ